MRLTSNKVKGNYLSIAGDAVGEWRHHASSPGHRTAKTIDNWSPTSALANLRCTNLSHSLAEGRCSLVFSKSTSRERQRERATCCPCLPPSCLPQPSHRVQPRGQSPC